MRPITWLHEDIVVWRPQRQFRAVPPKDSPVSITI